MFRQLEARRELTEAADQVANLGWLTPNSVISSRISSRYLSWSCCMRSAVIMIIGEWALHRPWIRLTIYRIAGLRLGLSIRMKNR